MARVTQGRGMMVMCGYAVRGLVERGRMKIGKKRDG